MNILKFWQVPGNQDIALHERNAVTDYLPELFARCPAVRFCYDLVYGDPGLYLHRPGRQWPACRSANRLAQVVTRRCGGETNPSSSRTARTRRGPLKGWDPSR